MSSATPPQQTRDEDTQPHGPLSGPEGCPPSTHRLKSDHARLTDSSIPQRPLRTLLLPLQQARQSRATSAQQRSREASAKRQRNPCAVNLERAIPSSIQWCWKSQPSTFRHAKTCDHTGNPGATRSRTLEIQVQASLLKSSSEGNPLRELESSLPVEIRPTDTVC